MNYMDPNRVFRGKLNCKDKNYWKNGDHCHYTDRHRGATHGMRNLLYNPFIEIRVVIHNKSNCDDYFIIKNLTKEFQSNGITSLNGNTEKCSFSLPIKKKTKKERELIEEICRTKFIDITRLMNLH